jgi:hypothetical protein
LRRSGSSCHWSFLNWRPNPQKAEWRTALIEKKYWGSSENEGSYEQKVTKRMKKEVRKMGVEEY